MSDGRQFTQYYPNDDMNCHFYKSLEVTDTRKYRHSVLNKTGDFFRNQDACLADKYANMQKQMQADLAKVRSYTYNN
jgi:hypothetical protein